jgi:rubredoxin
MNYAIILSRSFAGRGTDGQAKNLQRSGGLLHNHAALRKSRIAERTIRMNAEPYKSWQCRTCGYIYDEEAGAPEESLAPGTRWSDIPDDWVCPECGTAKSDFDMVEL